MAAPFSLTHQPIRYTTATGAGFQPMFLATNISGFDLLDVEAGIVAVEGAVTAFTVDLYTANQNQTDDGWLPIGTTLFTSITNNTWAKVSYQSGLLKFLRWKVSSITGGTAVTFFIRGMGRSYSAPNAAMPRMMPRQVAMPATQAVVPAAAAAATVADPDYIMPTIVATPTTPQLNSSILPFLNATHYLQQQGTARATPTTTAIKGIPGLGVASRKAPPIPFR